MKLPRIDAIQDIPHLIAFHTPKIVKKAKSKKRNCIFMLIKKSNEMPALISFLSKRKKAVRKTKGRISPIMFPLSIMTPHGAENIAIGRTFQNDRVEIKFRRYARYQAGKIKDRKVTNR